MATVKAKKKSAKKVKPITKTKARKKLKKIVFETVTPEGKVVEIPLEKLKQLPLEAQVEPAHRIEEAPDPGPHADLLDAAVESKSQKQHRPQKSRTAGELEKEQPALGGDEPHEDVKIDEPEPEPDKKETQANPLDDEELRDMAIEATVECEIGFFTAIMGATYASGHYGVDDKKILKSVWTYYFRYYGFPNVPGWLMLLIGHSAYIGQRTFGKEQREKVQKSFGKFWDTVTRKGKKTGEGETEEIVIDHATQKVDPDGKGAKENTKKVETTDGDPFGKDAIH